MENKGCGNNSIPEQLPAIASHATCNEFENNEFTHFTVASLPRKIESVVETNQSYMNETLLTDGKMTSSKGRATRDVFDIVRWLDVQENEENVRGKNASEVPEQVNEEECDGEAQVDNDQKLTVDDNNSSYHSWQEKWVHLGKTKTEKQRRIQQRINQLR